MITKQQNKEMLDVIEDKDDYPEVITKKLMKKYKITEFTGGRTYEIDKLKAIKYAKKVNGIVYTMVDGYGTTIDYLKGFHIFDRLGYAVIKK